MSIDATSTTAGSSGATRRSDARHAAQRALLVWQDAIWSDLSKLAARADTATGDPVIVFEGCETEPTFDGDYDVRDELALATLAGGGKRVELGCGTGPGWMWEQAVTLWDELREALAQVNGVPIEAALVCDLNERTVYVFSPYYCPDIGPEPVMLLDVDAPAAADADPFDALLAAVNTTDDGDARLALLLEAHRLSAPTRPAHGPDEDCLGDDAFLLGDDD